MFGNVASPRYTIRNDWYNVRNARLTGGTRRQHGNGRVLRRWLLPQSRGHSPRRSNGDKPGRVKFAYEPVTQKFNRAREEQDKVHIVRRSARHTRVRCLVWRQHHQSHVVGSFDVCTSLLRRRFERGFESLYVYSSIVEPRIVGDKIAPLLRIVPITGRHGEMVTTRFDHVQYIPVLSREFGSVETEIRDDTGRPVPFERGKVTVTLHFRRCSSGLFR